MSDHSPNQSPGECQEQDLSPQPSPALQPHPRPPPDPQRIPSSGLPERRRTSLCCPNTREIHDFGVVQHPLPCPSHVPCPALTTVPRPGATPKLGVRPVLPAGSSPRSQPPCRREGAGRAGSVPHVLSPCAPFCCLLGWSLLLLLLLLLPLLLLRRNPGPACSH